MKKSLACSAFYNGLYSVLNVLFPFVSSAYLARVLQPGGIGEVACGQNLVSYFGMLAALGIPQYGTREIARCGREQDRLFSELAVINFLSTLLAGAAYGVFLAAAPPENGLLYRVLGLELLFQLFNIDWLYQGKEEYGFIAARGLVVKLLSLAAMILLVRERADTVLYGLILCLGGGCGHIINVACAGKHVRLTLRGLKLRRHLAPVLTLMLSSVTASLYSKVDVTMLGVLAGDTQVGYYVSAHKVVNIVLTLAAAVTAVFLPRLSLTYQSDRGKYEEYLAVGLKAVLLLALPCCVGLLLTAEDLTAVLFGTAFAPAAGTIRILAVLVIIKGAGDLLCYQALISAGQEKKLISARILAGAANVVLNALLIPRWGHYGAAAASVASELVVNGTLLRVSLRIAKPKVEAKYLLGLVLSTALMTAVVLLVQSAWENALAALLLSAAAGGMAYFAAVLLMKKGGFL